jgi:hypothetical protein
MRGAADQEGLWCHACRPGRHDDFYYARLEPGAKAFSPARNINSKPSEGFSVAADDKGNVTACWLSGKLFANVSHDNGMTFGSNVEINPAYDPCNCCTTSAAYGADGKLAILYREETNNERDISSSGIKCGAKRRGLGSAPPCGKSMPAP